MLYWLKVVLLMILLGFVNIVYAQKGIWGLDDIDIISRKEWGADESLRYQERQEYQNQLKKIEERKVYLGKLKETNFEAYLKIKQKEYIDSYRYEYLGENYTQERSIDKIIKTENAKELWWPNRYHYKKDRIIIHHSADDNTQFKSKQDVISKINAIYKYHTLNKLRGDIGYNFLIDKFGNIYEGKAGGEGVIGAHSMYNNRSSIGISLIGNFETEQPTNEMMEALITLTSALSAKYNINPYDKVNYHKSSDQEPYIIDNKYYSIAGHTDSGRTVCPGKYIIQKYDTIRSTVYKNVFNKEIEIADIKVVNNDVKTMKISKIYFISKKEFELKTNMTIDGSILDCKAMEDTFEVIGCELKNNKVVFKLKYLKAIASGTKKILISGSKQNYLVKIKPIWQSDLDFMVEKKKDLYVQTSGLKFAKNFFPKITYKIDINAAFRLVNQKVKVLLYNLTIDYDNRDIYCKDKCDVMIDYYEFNGVERIKISKSDNKLLVKLDNNSHQAKTVKVINKNILKILNYNRASYAGIGWNQFKGNLLIQKENIKPIGKDILEKYVLINELKFEDYLKGIAEVNDQVSLEKAKAMALLVKTYAIFYLEGKNKHPSIPDGVSYNAVDDARIFQKYVGEGYSQTSKIWMEALESTKTQILIYDNYIPILPYFSCTAGFTFSAKEKFGWNDTPYLTSKLDFDYCSEFNGHGVGLSGKGAEMMAAKGANYKQILKYYYNGIKILNFY